jgi:invasion protein IalB
MKTSLFLAGLAVSFALCLSAAQAQDASAQAPATSTVADTAGDACAPAQPGVDAHCVGNWLVRCFKVQGQSRCDMFQQVADKNTQQSVLSLSIAYIPAANRRAVQVVVPLMVSIPKGIKIVTDSYSSPVLPYTSCERTGCYAATLLDDAVLQGISGSSGNARVMVTGDNGREVGIAFSLKGFSQALDQMTAQTKARTAGAAPAAPAKP